MVWKARDAAPGLSIFPDHIPCGQCFGCRLDYSCDWAMRCDKETQMHEKNCFITLTYGPEFVPRDGGLQLDDWRYFMKKLRREVGDVRYFHAGEYGGRYGRPHDHALLFGVDFVDRVFFKYTPSGEKIYTSETLSRVWGKGYCSVGEATFKSAAYLARYCLKKITGKAKEEVDANGLRPYDRVLDHGEIVELRPEYLTMSRNPGIARSWFEKFFSDVYPHDYVVVRGGMKMPPPKYFDYLLELRDPEMLSKIKAARLQRCTKKEEVWNETLKKMQWLDVNRDERLVVMEEFMKSKYKLYSRPLEV